MSDYYGDEDNIKKIIAISGLVPDQDLGLEDDDPEGEDAKTKEEKFFDLIEEYFIVAKSYIDANRNRSFSEDTPPGIINISERIVMNILSYINQSRSSPIIQSDDFNIQFLEDNIMTQSIRDDLADFKSGPTEHKGMFAVSISNRHTREGDDNDD